MRETRKSLVVEGSKQIPSEFGKASRDNFPPPSNVNFDKDLLEPVYSKGLVANDSYRTYVEYPSEHYSAALKSEADKLLSEHMEAIRTAMEDRILGANYGRELSDLMNSAKNLKYTTERKSPSEWGDSLKRHQDALGKVERILFNRP